MGKEMEVLPHLSAYLLIISFVLNFIYWWMPSPFGKFSIKDPPSWTCTIVPNNVFRVLIFVWFGTIYSGWFEGEDWIWYHTWPSSNRGWFVLIWLSVYYALKLISAPVFETYSGDNAVKKKVPLLAFFPYIFFWGPAGWYWRRASSTVDVKLEYYDYILMVLLVLFLALNLYTDVSKNIRRQIEGKLYSNGWYLSEEQLYDNFSSMKGLWHTFSLPPNYMFEVAHWFVFIFISHSWEGLWWFCSIFMFLVTRGVWQKKWYRVKTVASVVTQMEVKEEEQLIPQKLTF